MLESFKGFKAILIYHNFLILLQIQFDIFIGMRKIFENIKNNQDICVKRILKLVLVLKKFKFGYKYTELYTYSI